VFAGLVVLELGLLAFVDRTTAPLERAGRPFLLRDIPAGAVISQRFEVSAHGLDEIRLDGAITAGAGAARLDAQILEVQNDGSVIQVARRAAVDVAPGATGCCLVRFEPVPDSRWKNWRLDLTVGELSGRQLSLWAVPGPVNGRLTINGRRQTAFLVFATGASEGTGLGRLRAGSAGKIAMLAMLALLYNAIVAAAVAMLASASDLRPA
jgi:hypothetical protein